VSSPGRQELNESSLAAAEDLSVKVVRSKLGRRGGGAAHAEKERWAAQKEAAVKRVASSIAGQGQALVQLVMSSWITDAALTKERRLADDAKTDEGTEEQLVARIRSEMEALFATGGKAKAQQFAKSLEDILAKYE